MLLLACATLATLGVAACQSEERAQFYVPPRIDGGDFNGTIGGDAGPDGGARGDAGPKPPEKPVFNEAGDPMRFDPTQVYVHGRFDGGNEGKSVHGLPCADGGASAFADWSSKGDWKNPNKTGITVALPCETADVGVRIDGSILYKIAGFAMRLFTQDDMSVNGRHLAVPVQPETGATGDTEILLCTGQDVRHWVSPEDGMTVCRGADDMMMTIYMWKDARVESLDFPDGYWPAHLGYGQHVLMQQVGTPKRVGVWSPDDGLKKVADLLPFQFEEVGAIRAEQDGFVVLVVKRDDDPPALSQWHISNSGKLGNETKYPTLEGVTLDPSNCEEYFPGGVPLSGTLNPGLSVDHMRSRGCACALDADGAALCIARDAKMSPLIVRFEIGAQAGTIAYRVEKDPFLIDFKGLVTGP